MTNGYPVTVRCHREERASRRFSSDPPSPPWQLPRHRRNGPRTFPQQQLASSSFSSSFRSLFSGTPNSQILFLDQPGCTRSSRICSNKRTPHQFMHKSCDYFRNHLHPRVELWPRLTTFFLKWEIREKKKKHVFDLTEINI